MDDPTLDEKNEAWNLAQIRQRPPRFQAAPIAKAIKQLMVRTGLNQNQAILQTQQSWTTAVGPQLALVSRPGNLVRGVLQVFARDSSALQELHLRRSQILKAMQQAMPEADIKDIRFKVG
jgi:predicted nucleic acid-binding Zn ribbon protein